MKKKFQNFKIENYEFYVGGFNLDWFSKYLGNNPQTIIEFGSYDGGDGVRYKTAYEDCKIYSIEACPQRYNVIFPLAEKFGLLIYNMAVSDVDGQIEFYQVEDDNVVDNKNKCGSSGSINPRTDFYKKKFPHIKEKKKILVNSTRLDTFCRNQNIEKVDLIHCDVEGAEHRVVYGLGNLRPKLLWLEMHLGKKYYGEQAYDAGELDLYLSQIGYKRVEQNGADCLYCFNQ